MSELSDRLRRMAARGDTRGAADVFAAAQADAAQPAAADDAVAPAPVAPLFRQPRVLTAMAAAVLVIAGMAGALTIDTGGKQPIARRQASATTTSTTGDAPTTLSEATKVYLASTRLVPFNQCGALSSYAKTQALKTVGPYGLPGGISGYATDLAAGSGAAASDSLSGAPKSERQSAAPSVAAPDAHSDTNVQEAGIDEPDSVKTDGKTIFQVTNGKVFATAAGANPQLLGSLPIEGASEMLRISDKLIVISPGYGVYATDMRNGREGGSGVASYPYGGGLQSRFTVVDVSNPRAMKITGHLDVDGSYISARTVDGVARLVVRSAPDLTFQYPQDGTPEAQAAAKQHNTDVVRAANLQTWLPHFTATDARGKEQKGQAFACDASYRPPQFSGFGLLSVLSFNTENPSYTRAASVMANGEIVYASGTRIYVATNSWGDVSADGQTVTPSASSLIHAFDISDPVQAVYRESGKVRGTILNQWSMSEYKGALRVATTDTGASTESFVTVLGDSGQALLPVGQVGGLGKGERIYGVRFIDAVGYVVTFRQVDPLYVIDLSEPTKPKLVGELEISGYSAYLHPIGRGLLLGVGQEASAEGRRAGFQASIFDVHDPTAPKLLARHVVEAPGGGSSSTAEFDHHAFLYWPATKLAVVPLNVYSYDTNTQQNFAGALGLHVDDTSIDEVGRVQPPHSNDPQYGQVGVDRSVVVGDRLYLTTTRGLLVTRLDNLQQTGWVAY